MAAREVLLLGNPKLYEVCAPVEKSGLEGLENVVEELHDTRMDCRQRIGEGRAIAGFRPTHSTHPRRLRP